jgi:hypothetical protein
MKRNHFEGGAEKLPLTFLLLIKLVNLRISLGTCDQSMGFNSAFSPEEVQLTSKSNHE